MAGPMAPPTQVSCISCQEAAAPTHCLKQRKQCATQEPPIEFYWMDSSMIWKFALTDTHLLSYQEPSAKHYHNHSIYGA